MATENRTNLVAQLERRLSARIVTMVTGDRQGMETRIAPDVLPLVSEHLLSIGFNETIALFIYTPGGDTIAAWSIVNLIRQYCKQLKVLVPFRALSCGTLIALGADEIMMGRHGLLSPVDPSVASPFNPPAPGAEQLGRMSTLPVSVEDLIGFLDLARKEIGLKSEDSMVAALNILASKVHPLALGAVFRAREHSSSLARRLLLSHSTEEAKAERIVAKLTKELPTHSYLIGRAEALTDVELNVVEPEPDVETLMWALYKEYEGWLKLTSPASAELDLATEERKRVQYERAAVESLRDGHLVQHIFTTVKDLERIKVAPPGMQAIVDQIVERIIYQGWVAATDGEVPKWS